MHYYNSMIFVGEDGRTLATFDKAHLVPFGEYVPLKGLFRALDAVFEALGLGIRFQKVVEGGGDFVPQQSVASARRLKALAQPGHRGLAIRQHGQRVAQRSHGGGHDHKVLRL